MSSTIVNSSNPVSGPSRLVDFPPSLTSSKNPSSIVPPPLKKKKQLVGWQHSLAGSLGGMAGAIVTSPFDVVKTRLQSDLFKTAASKARSAATASILAKEAAAAAALAPTSAGRPGIVGTLWQFVDTVALIRRIAVEEGWRALYKGLGPSLVGIIPARAINFYFYPTSKAFLARQFPNAPTEKADQTSEDSPFIHLGAAVIAGIFTASGTNPIWVVKTRLQLSARKRDTTTTLKSPLPQPIAASSAALRNAALPPKPTAASVTMDIIRNEGIRGLYRGLSASYLGVSEGVIQWVLYERFKRIGRPTTSNSEDQKQSLLSYMGSIIGASGGAKAVASLITYPHEVVRTRLRQPAINGVTKYHSLLQTFKLVLKEEGVASLYGGLTAHMFRVVPNAACMFLIYELVAERLGS